MDEPTCSLEEMALAERLEAWQALASNGVAVDTQPGRSVSDYPNRPDIVQRLDELIVAERDCCSFLDFTVEDRGEHLRVELRYPPEFEAMLAQVTPAR